MSRRCRRPVSFHGSFIDFLSFTMRVNRKHILIAVGILLVSAAAYVGLAKQTEPQSKQVCFLVFVFFCVVVEYKPVPITIYSTGYLTAFNTVEVRPQVQNVVRAVHVSEGQDVRAGQLLFTLDPRGDTSNVDKARAQLARDRADLAAAENTLMRNQELLAKHFVSQAVGDSARSRVESLRGTVKADQAAIESSNVALGYNRFFVCFCGCFGVFCVFLCCLVFLF